MYISDQENQRIRMVDLNGVITTVAGTGRSGFSGDGGPATAAQIFAPEGQSAPPTSRIATDYVGNLYLADTFNNRIRMVDLDGRALSTSDWHCASGMPTFSMAGSNLTAYKPRGSPSPHLAWHG